jgi:hypothetical protein
MEGSEVSCIQVDAVTQHYGAWFAFLEHEFDEKLEYYVL